MFIRQIKTNWGSPTRIDVVKKTTVESERLSKECASTFAVIIYDLPIAKIGKKAQNKESNKFKGGFIVFRAFYIKGSILSTFGKLTEGSWSLYLLTKLTEGSWSLYLPTESGVIEPESMNWFLKGKMYNLWRWGHILLSTALHGLNLYSFLKGRHTDINFTDNSKVRSEIKLGQWPTIAKPI